MLTRTPATNSTHPKVAVQWLNQALCFYQSLCLVDSEVLRNRHLRVAAKRCPAMPSLRFGTAGQRGGDYISCCACAFANASALRTTRDLRKF